MVAGGGNLDVRDIGCMSKHPVLLIALGVHLLDTGPLILGAGIGGLGTRGGGCAVWPSAFAAGADSCVDICDDCLDSGSSEARCCSSVIDV